MIKLVLLPPAAWGVPAILEGAPAGVRCDSEFAMPQRDRTPATRFFTAAYGWARTLRNGAAGPLRRQFNAQIRSILNEGCFS